MRNSPHSLTERERAVVRALQGDVPICEAPFQVLASRIGVSEEELLDVVRDMKARGILRRFGATLRHQRVGFRANAMSAWIVPEERIEEVARHLAALPQVTHCYQRTPRGGLPYNLYAMIHAEGQAACEGIAAEIARKTGVGQYVLLFSSRENKKESMQYF
jgi:DNA-binding Lrp family transcriptional regulator